MESANNQNVNDNISDFKEIGVSKISTKIVGDENEKNNENLPLGVRTMLNDDLTCDIKV